MNCRMLRKICYSQNRMQKLKVYHCQSLLVAFYSQNKNIENTAENSSKAESKRLAEFRKKLRETTPINDLGEQAEYQTKNDDPLPPFPNNTNPDTGEVGGPRGPEPTRYGDWERKGRVSDF